MQKNLTTLGVIAILGATLAISGIAIQDAMAANSANKTSFQSMEMSVIMAAESGLEQGSGNGTLAYASMKASNPQDVLILYDEVCSLYTEVQLKGGKKNNDSYRDNFAEEMDEVQATHAISLWIDDKKYRESITMCDRTYGVETNILSELEELCEVVANDPDTTADDELTCDPIFYRSWIETNAAHGWHWVIVNLGSEHDLNDDGMIDFEIRGSATLVDKQNLDTTGVAVGLRSLTVIPVHLDVDT
jgi:hypothetical protein